MKAVDHVVTADQRKKVNKVFQKAQQKQRKQVAKRSRDRSGGKRGFSQASSVLYELVIVDNDESEGGRMLEKPSVILKSYAFWSGV